MRNAVGYADYFVVCSGNTERQVKAIHDGIHEGLKKEDGMLPRRVEGLRESRWVLMDYLDVVVHVFTPEAREYSGWSSSGAKCLPAPSELRVSSTSGSAGRPPARPRPSASGR